MSAYTYLETCRRKDKVGKHSFVLVTILSHGLFVHSKEITVSSLENLVLEELTRGIFPSLGKV